MQEILERLKGKWEPHSGQLAYLQSNAKFKVLACGRRWGKTDACAVEIAAAMLGQTPCKHLILAPTADQAKLLFERSLELLEILIGKRRAKAALAVRRTPYPHLRLGPHLLMARSGHLGRTLRGNEATHIVVDEAAYLPEAVINEVAMPMLATTDGKLTLISTPNGLNHFWRFYQLGVEGKHGVWSRAGPSSESPMVSSSFLAIQRELISDRAFRIEYEAKFIDSIGRVFSTAGIDGCLVCELPRVEGPYYVGIDWGRYTDATAVAVLSGDGGESYLVEMHRFADAEWDDQVEAIGEIVDRYSRALVLCDGTGMGDPAVAMLRHRLAKHEVQPYVFTNASKQVLVDRLAQLVTRRGVRMLPNPDLIRELQHFEAKVSSTGKRTYGAVHGYHDDMVIALALAAHQLPMPYRPEISVGGKRKFGYLC